MVLAMSLHAHETNVMVTAVSVWAVAYLVGRIVHPRWSYGCYPARATLPYGRYLLAPLTGNIEGREQRMYGTPTLFPSNHYCTLVDSTSLPPISSVWCPKGLQPLSCNKFGVVFIQNVWLISSSSHCVSYGGPPWLIQCLEVSIVTSTRGAPVICLSSNTSFYEHGATWSAIFSSRTKIVQSHSKPALSLPHRIDGFYANRRRICRLPVRGCQWILLLHSRLGPPLHLPHLLYCVQSSSCGFPSFATNAMVACPQRPYRLFVGKRVSGSLLYNDMWIGQRSRIRLTC